MPRPESPCAARAGFTLIEALVALAVMAAVIAAVAGLATTSLRSAVQTGRRLALVETAREILVAMPGRNDLADGRLDGALDGHSWTLLAWPDADPPPTAAPPAIWRPQAIALTVRSPTGDAVEVDTVRLVRQGAP